MGFRHVERWHHVDFSKQKSVVKKQPFWSLETVNFLSMARNPLVLQGSESHSPTVGAIFGMHPAIEVSIRRNLEDLSNV